MELDSQPLCFANSPHSFGEVIPKGWLSYHNVEFQLRFKDNLSAHPRDLFSITEDENVVLPKNVEPNALFKSQAKVRVFGAKLPGAQVAFYVEGGGGGHEAEAHKKPRPLGTFSNGKMVQIKSMSEAEVDPNNPNLGGIIQTTYTANEFGGMEQIVAVVSDGLFQASFMPLDTLEDQDAARESIKQEATEDKNNGIGCQLGAVEIEVKVPDLTELTATSDIDPVGATPEHSKNHFGKTGIDQAVTFLATKFKNDTSRQLLVNDMSLEWGGIFDICGKWDPTKTCPAAPSGGHSRKYGHSFGRAADMNFSSSQDKKTIKKILKEYMKFKQKVPGSSTPFTTKAFFDEGNHFHIMR